MKVQTQNLKKILKNDEKCIFFFFFAIAPLIAIASVIVFFYITVQSLKRPNLFHFGIDLPLLSFYVVYPDFAFSIPFQLWLSVRFLFSYLI